MPRLVLQLLALVAGAAAAVLVGCGDTSNLIPAGDASRLKDRIAEVRSAIQAGDCAAATDAVQRAQGSADLLDRTIDSRLRSRIRQGLKKLADDVPTACQEVQTQTESIPTVTEAPTTTATTPTTPTTSTPTTTTPTDTTPTDTTPTTTEPATTTTAPPPDSGGTPPDQETLP